MTIPEKTNQEKIVRMRFSKLRNLMKLANKYQKKKPWGINGHVIRLEKAILETDKNTYTYYDWVQQSLIRKPARHNNQTEYYFII